MVCNRCIMVVRQELERLGFRPTKISLGEITFDETISQEHKEQIGVHLNAFGFVLIDDKKSRHIEQIKSAIITLIHQRKEALQINLSDYLIEIMHYDYNYLSNLFSEVEGITIEKYYISQKIERVKELLVYDELSLSEIAYELHYSSVAHLSNQFKKVTGLTPSHFKKIRTDKRISLDEV